MLTATLLAACGQDKSAIKAMEEESIALHDEVMPEMGTIIELKGQLKARMAAIDTTDVNALAEVEALYMALENAEEGMKNWMHTYQVPDYKKPLEELEPVASAQLEAIKQVHSEMKKSIADAQAALAE